MGQGISAEEAGLPYAVAGPGGNGAGGDDDELVFLEEYEAATAAGATGQRDARRRRRQIHGEADDEDSDMEVENMVFEIGRRAGTSTAHIRANNLPVAIDANGVVDARKSLLFDKSIPAADNIFAPRALPGAANQSQRAITPDETLRLQRVYGYRGGDCRHNIHYDAAGEHVIYSVASVGVVMKVADGGGEGGGASRHGTETLSQSFAMHHCGAELTPGGTIGRQATEIACVAVCHSVPIPASALRMRTERFLSRSKNSSGSVGDMRIDIAASADDSGRVCVWDVHTRELLAEIWNNGRNSDVAEGSHGVCCMCFTEDGKYLALVGTDAMHTVSIYEWAKHRTRQAAGATSSGATAGNAGTDAAGQSKLVEGGTGSRRVPGGRLLLSCSGDMHNRITSVHFIATESTPRLVTCGRSHLRFYTVLGDRLLGKHASFSKQSAVRSSTASSSSASLSFQQHSPLSRVTCTCLAFLPDGATLVGSLSGAVYKFDDGETHVSKRYARVHRGAVFDMTFVEHESSQLVVTCGKDSRIKIFTAFMELQRCIDIHSLMSMVLMQSNASCSSVSAPTTRSPFAISLASSMRCGGGRGREDTSDGIRERSLHRKKQSSKLLVGLSTSDILELDFEALLASDTVHDGAHRVLMRGHECPRPQGVAGSTQVVHSGGGAAEDDSATTTTGRAVCVACHPSRQLAVTTCQDGSVRMWSLDSHALCAAYTLRHAGTCIDFNSKHSDFLAVGDAGGTVHILSMASQGLLMRVHVITMGSAAQATASVTRGGGGVGAANLVRGAEGVSVVKFSPCGKYLAVGSLRPASMESSVKMEGKARSKARTVHRSKDLVGVVTIFAATGAYSNGNGFNNSGVDTDSSRAGVLGFTRLGECVGLSDRVRSIDWSADGSLLRTNSVIGELLFFDTTSGPNFDVVPGGSDAARAATWHSGDCGFVYEACGVWPADGSIDSVTSVCRSNELDDADDALMATTESSGRLCLYRFPADVGRAVAKGYPMMPSASKSRMGMACRFSFLDKYLVSTLHSLSSSGVCVWEVIDNDDNDDAESDACDDRKGHTRGDGKLKLLAKNRSHSTTASEKTAGGFQPRAPTRGSKAQMMVLTGIENGVNVYEPVSVGEGGLPNPLKNHSLAELGAKKGYRSPLVGLPCMTQMEVPNGFKLDVASAYQAPGSRLVPSWVYGYSGGSCRQNLFYTADGCIAFPAGCFGIVLNPLTRTQRHITDSAETGDVVEGNVDPISCMARCTSDKTIFATGECAMRPRIVVWSSTTMKAISELHGYFRTRVVSLCFNPSGRLIAALGYTGSGGGGGGPHSESDATMGVGIYDWRTEVLVCTYALGRAAVHHVNWSPYDSSIVTCGDKHVKFVLHATEVSGDVAGPPTSATLQQLPQGDDQGAPDRIASEADGYPDNVIRKGNKLTVTRGKIKGVKHARMQRFNCSAFTAAGIAIVGCDDGSLYVFTNSTLAHVVPDAHEGSVQCVFSFQDLVISGGDDGTVRFWAGGDNSLKRLHKVSLPCATAAAATTTTTAQSSQSIRSLSCDSRQRVLVGTDANEVYEISDVPRLITRGHGDAMMWGFCLHPYKDVFASGSDDGTLRLWSWSSRTAIHAVHMKTVVYESVRKMLTMTMERSSGQYHRATMDRNAGVAVTADGVAGSTSTTFAGSGALTSHPGGGASGDAGSMSADLEHRLKELVVKYADVDDNDGEETDEDEGGREDSIKLNIDPRVRSIAFSHQEDVLAAGTVDGHVYLLSLPSLDIVNMIDNGASDLMATTAVPSSFAPAGSASTATAHVATSASSAVSVVKYSPDGRYLCVGGHSGRIHVYDVADRFRHLGCCRGHTAPVTKIDWTVDSKHITSNAADFQILSWAVPTCQRVREKRAVSEFYYQTFTRVLGWESLGVWFRGAEGNDVNTVDRSPDGSLLATGDDRGLVTLFKHPALGGRGIHHAGHGGDVTNVSFAPSGGAVFSTANDGNIVEWRLISSQADPTGRAHAHGPTAPAAIGNAASGYVERM